MRAGARDVEVVENVHGEPVPLEDDHIRIEGEHLPRREFATLDEYAAHPDCWADVTAEWHAPA
jgi:hypothetical protein